MGFNIGTIGCERTEITDGQGNTAAVLHRPVSLGWRAAWDKLAARLVRAAPDAPEPPPDGSEDAEQAGAYVAAAQAYLDDVAAYQREIQPDRVRFFRRLLDDLVEDLDGFTINDAPASVSDVLDALESAGGQHDPGQPLIALGEAVMLSSRIEPEAGKD